jgi:WD40 repeat protein
MIFRSRSFAGRKDRREYAMIRKCKSVSWLFSLILLAIPLIGCVQSVAEPEARTISGRVVVSGEESGLAGVSVLVVDGTGSYVETDAEGYFEVAALDDTVIVPRKTGYRFVPEKQVVGEAQELEFVAYPWTEVDFASWGPQLSFTSHTDWVEAIAFSADDEYMVSGGSDRTIRIWKTADGQLVRTLTGHTRAIKVLAFSPDGHYLASGAAEGKIKIWDWQTGLEVKTLQGHTDVVTDLAWSPDGTKLASSGWDRAVRIWDISSGEELQSCAHENWVRAVVWSPDGRFLLSGGDDLRLMVWDAGLWELSAQFEISDRIMSLEAAPDGSLAAMALGSGAVQVLDLRTGEEVFLEQDQGRVLTPKWSYDGRYLAAGTDKLIQIWDWKEQRLVHSINTGTDILALAWGWRTHLLASGGPKGVIDLWSAESGESALRITGHTGAVKALAWSPQGQYLASGGDDRLIRIWDLDARRERLQLLPGHSGPIEVLAWSPDGTYLASGGHDFLVRVWKAAEGEYLGAFTERLKKPFVHEKGFEFAVGMKSVSHEDIVLSLSWAPNSKRLASASWDKTVAIWDVQTRTQLVGVQNPEGWITAVAWSPHGDQIAFGGRDQVIHVYSGVTGEEIKKLEGHTSWIRSLAWSPDGRYLASSSYDRTVSIWDVDADEIVRTLSGDDSVVTALAWSPCGRYLAGGSHSGTVQIWDVGTGGVLYTYPGRVLGLQAVAWSPQGDQLAITEYNSIIILGELD